MRSWIKMALITLGCADCVLLAGCHHGTVGSDGNKSGRTGPIAGAGVPGRPDAETPSMGQIAQERARALLAEVEAETPEESVRNLLYRTMFVISPLWSCRPGPEGLVSDTNRNPRVQKLLRIVHEGTDGQRQAVRDAILRMIHVYLTELPESSPEGVAWQPSVRDPGGAVTYFYFLSHLDADPASTLKLLVDVHLHDQAAWRHHLESRRPPGQQERPQSMVLTEHGQFLAMAADQLLATIRSREDLQKGLTQPQLDVLHRFERQRQTVASEGADELRILKDATKFVYPLGVPGSARPAGVPGSQPVTRPAQDRTPRDAEERLTRIYDVQGPADGIARHLEKLVAAMSGSEVVIRSSPATRQIVVIGDLDTHKMVEDLLPQIKWQSMTSGEPALSEPVIRQLNLEDASIADVASSLWAETGLRIGFEMKEPPERCSISLHDLPLSEVAETLAGLYSGCVVRYPPAGPTLMLKSSPLHEARGRYQILEPTRLADALPIIGRQIAQHLGPDHTVIAGIMGSGTSPSPFQNVTVDVQGDAYDALDAIVAQTEDLNWRIRWSNDGRVWISVRAARVHAPARTDNLTVYNRDEEMRRRREAVSRRAAATTTQPGGASASRNVEQQLTKAYDVGESADEIATALNRFFIARPGSQANAWSSPATNQIIVTGNAGVHDIVGSLLNRVERPAGESLVVLPFYLRTREAASWVEVVRDALCNEPNTVALDVETNCLLIAATENDKDRIAYLVAVLDRLALTGDGKTMDRLEITVRLKRAKAADVVDVITRLYPMPTGIPESANPQAVLDDAVTASSPKESEDTILISASPRLGPEIKALIPLLDTARPADVQLGKVLALENQDAEEVASLLRAELPKDPTMHWEITVATRTNSLIVQANIACLESIAAVFQALDKPEAWRGDPKESMREPPNKHKGGSASQTATHREAEIERHLREVLDSDRLLCQRWDFPPEQMDAIPTDKLLQRLLERGMGFEMISSVPNVGIERLLRASTTAQAFLARKDIAEAALKLYQEWKLKPEEMTDEYVSRLKSNDQIMKFPEMKALIEDPNHPARLNVAHASMGLMHCDRFLLSPRIYKHIEGHAQEFIPYLISRYRQMREVEKQFGDTDAVTYSAAIGSTRDLCLQLAQSSNPSLFSKLQAVPDLDRDGFFQLLEAETIQLRRIETQPASPTRPAATGPTADALLWGEEVEGLRCRLALARSVLQEGEWPQVILYVRDRASRVMTSYFEVGDDSPWVSCELDLDGRWHPVQLDVRDRPDGSKVLVSLGNGPPSLGWTMRFWDATKAKQPRPLAAGTHTLRAAFTVSVSAGTGVRPIRAVSNPVEIEILPAGDEATRPADAARPDDLEVFIKHRWRNGEPAYRDSRWSVTKESLPRLHQMLKDPAWVKHWGTIAYVIGHISSDESSVPTLLDYVRRREDFSDLEPLEAVTKSFPKYRVVRWLGRIGGPEATKALRAAVTVEGSEQLAEAWADDPKLLATLGGKRAIGRLIADSAAVGLVLTRDPDNIKIVEQRYQDGLALPRPVPYGAYALAVNRVIEERGLESVLSMLSTEDEQEVITPITLEYVKPAKELYERKRNSD